MKLPLRYFLIVCLLLGAVAVPVGWRRYQKWKADEIERLQRELVALWENEPLLLYAGSGDPSGRGDDTHSKWEVKYSAWEKRIREIEDRLERLTGKRPVHRRAFRSYRNDVVGGQQAAAQRKVLLQREIETLTEPRITESFGSAGCSVSSTAVSLSEAMTSGEQP